MKVNKKLIASIIVGALLLTSGGLAMANDTEKWGNKITQEEADQYRDNMQSKMNGQRAERQILKNEQLNINLNTMVNNGDLTLEQANAIKEKFTSTCQEKMGKRQARMRLLQEPDFLADLTSEGILSAEEAEAFAQGMCRYR